jgi:predicted metal-binding membrane protein
MASERASQRAFFGVSALLFAASAGAAASFLGMWVVMMAAMMLPFLAPMLPRYREAIERTGETHLGRLTFLSSTGTGAKGLSRATSSSRGWP